MIFLSLLSNVICFYLIFILWKKLDQQGKTNQIDSTEDLAELLELFAQEMKEENARLQEIILQYSKEARSAEVSTSSEVQSEQVKTDLSAQFQHDNHPERNKVLLLAREGYNAEEIAKKLDRGKGEIELLLKFYA